MESRLKGWIPLFMALVIIAGCSDDKKNRVPLDQVKPDGSNDYRYIFRDTLDEEQEEKTREEREQFR